MKTWADGFVQKYARLYQISSILGALDFSRSLFLIYFSSVGFSGSEIGILQAALFWSTFAFELPSGVWADRFGRKRSVLTGLAALAVTFVILAYAVTFAGALGGFVLWGISFAFISGAGAALLYDGLKEADRSQLHLRWMSRTRSLCTVSLGVSIVLGGWIYSHQSNGIFLATAFTAVLAMVFLLPIPEPRHHMDVAGPREPISRAIVTFFRSAEGRRLVAFMAGMALIEMAHTPFFIFSQMLFKSAGLEAATTTWIFGLGFIGSAVAQHLAPKFGRVGLVRLVLSCSLFAALALAALAVQPSLPWLVAIFVIANSVPMLLFVHTDQYVQDHCSSEIRASLLSLQSFVNALFIGLSYLLIGAALDRWGPWITLASLAVPVLFGAILVCTLMRRMQV